MTSLDTYINDVAFKTATKLLLSELIAEVARLSPHPGQVIHDIRGRAQARVDPEKPHWPGLQATSNETATATADLIDHLCDIGEQRLRAKHP